MGIFKAYDIRGVYGQELIDDVFYKIARAYARLLGNPKKIVVARDIRPHSEPLFAAFARGLNDAGADVIDVGHASTPMSYFANGTLRPDGSVMITASHNTKEWNGCKLCRANAVPISGANGIKDIERMVLSGDLGEPAAVKGTRRLRPPRPLFRAHGEAAPRRLRLRKRHGDLRGRRVQGIAAHV